MTEQELRRRSQAAVREAMAPFRVLLLGSHERPPVTPVDRLLCTWRRLSEDERSEFLQRAIRGDRAKT